MIMLWCFAALMIGLLTLITIIVYRYQNLTSGKSNPELDVDWVINYFGPTLYGTIFGFPAITLLFCLAGYLPGTTKKTNNDL